jgi:tRNA (mo5U34)-methyltransferase
MAADSMMRRLFRRGGAIVRSESDRLEPYAALPSLADDLSDADIGRLNEMLPWAAFTLDTHGRRLGRAHSERKRQLPQVIPDPRIEELDRRYGLRGRRVLEVGCFEGIHTIALARCGAEVTAVDARIENVAKSAVRCAVYGVRARFGVWDVELPAPKHLSVACDVLHHVGVLYHLADPVAHLAYLLPQVGHALMLDTHVAPPGPPTGSYASGGRSHAYRPFRESGRQDPFSGMRDHAKWLPQAALLELLQQSGFSAEEVRVREERNGPRALIYARRGSATG